MRDSLKPGTIVKHMAFGKGVIKAIRDDVADVIFCDFGKKTVLVSYLRSLDSSIFEDSRPSSLDQIIIKPKVEISTLQVVKFLKDYLLQHKAKQIKINEALKLIRSELNEEIPADFAMISLDPIFNAVNINSLIEKESKILSNEIKNDICVIDSNISDVCTSLPTIENLDDFELACIKEKIDSTVQLFFAKEIIKFALSIEKPSRVNVLFLTDIAESILNIFLKQMSIGYFCNEAGKRNPLFYNVVHGYIQDNELSDDEKNDSLRYIKAYLVSNVIDKFCIIGGRRSKNIYLTDKNKNLVFGESFVKLAHQSGESLDKRLTNRIRYFMAKNNCPSSQLQHYLGILGKSESDSENLILKFQYQTNLNKLSMELNDDLIPKDVFLKLMGKYEIPTTEGYFEMCVARIDYTLRSKRILLSNKYSSLTSYYRSQVLKEDVYRYSNPYNLDEYDSILKSLLANLDIIDVGYGVYVTKTNMTKNGILDWVIDDFKHSVVDYVSQMRFVSLQELIDHFKNNKIVEYCGENQQQLIQFIRPINEIGINELQSGSFILTIKNSKHYKGDFITFIFGKAKSMDIYDIRDYVKDYFDVEYSIDEIIRDLKHTSLYYSEEMEKAYKNKEEFIMEVYGDGNKNQD